MNFDRTIRRLSYSATLRRLVRTFGLADVARNVYLKTYADKHQRCTYEVAGYKGSFWARTPSELRVIEAITFRETALPVLLKHVRPGETIMDVGANRGVYTILLAQAVGASGHLLALEPDSRSFERLAENVQLNDLGDRVFSFKLALGREAGTAELCLFDEAMAAISQVREDAADVPREIISVLSGDEFIAKYRLPHPNVVKIDVEGFEFAVLQGLSETLRQSTCRLICCEVHPDKLPSGISGELVRELLMDHGFSAMKILPCPPEYHLFAARSNAELD